MKSFIRKSYEMYRDGFKSMTLGRTLWILIAIKLAIMFFVVKLLFFPDKLSQDYNSDAERSQAVREALLKS